MTLSANNIKCRTAQEEMINRNECEVVTVESQTLTWYLYRDTSNHHKSHLGVVGRYWVQAHPEYMSEAMFQSACLKHCNHSQFVVNISNYIATRELKSQLSGGDTFFHEYMTY